MSDELVTRRADLAFGVLEMFASIALFIALYGVFNIIAVDLFGGLGLDASGSELSRTQSNVKSIWTLLPLIALFVIALRLLSRAAFESRGGA
jgi:membrane protein insertase Oxa1/YidC/SpoIIIJ